MADGGGVEISWQKSPTTATQMLTRSGSARALQDLRSRDTANHQPAVDSEERNAAAAAAEAAHKKRHRRNRKAGEHHQAAKRAWKPYTDMTWDERRAKDEDDAKRARRRRDSRIASGQAMAPYNTTQFLMEQYDNEEDVDFRRLSGSLTGDSSSPDDDDGDLKEMMFLQKKEFAVDYETARADHLRSRTKEELIRDLVEIETKVENMKGVYVGPFPEDWNAEVERLKEENARLARENCRLRAEMAALKSSTHPAIEVAVCHR